MGNNKEDYKTQDTRHKTQDTRHKTQDTRHKTQDTRRMFRLQYNSILVFALLLLLLLAGTTTTMGRGAIRRGNARRRRAAKLAQEKAIQDAAVVKLRQETRIVIANCVHTNYARVECISLPHFYESSHAQLFTSGYDAIMLCGQSATTQQKQIIHQPTIWELVICGLFVCTICGSVILSFVGCCIRFM